MRIFKIVIVALLCAVCLAGYVFFRWSGGFTAGNEVSSGLDDSFKAVAQRKKELSSGVDTRLPWEKLKGYEQHKFLSRIKGSHKIDIHPVTPSTGIATGMVIAYGHIFRGPYLLEDTDGKLVINGVQVKPSLFIEKIQKEALTQNRTESAAPTKIDKITKDVQSYYKWHILIFPKSLVKNRILAMISSSSDVFKNPKWKSDDSIEVELADCGLKYRITLSPLKLYWQKLMFTPTKKRLEQNRQDFMNLYRGPLLSGGTDIFVSDGYEVGVRDIRNKVVPIMKVEGLSREERIEKLHSVGIDYGLAEDIVDNYTPAEWTHH